MPELARHNNIKVIISCVNHDICTLALWQFDSADERRVNLSLIQNCQLSKCYLTVVLVWGSYRAVVICEEFEQPALWQNVQHVNLMNISTWNTTEQRQQT